MELSDQEREELMACEFVVVRSNGDEIPGKLVDIDFDIGITIINRNDSTDYLACIRSSLIFPEATPEEVVIYKFLFDAMLTGIKGGKVEFSILQSIIKNTGKFLRAGAEPSSETCAFNK